MTFTEWYKATEGYEWHPDYALLYGEEFLEGYEMYCEENKIKPVWNVNV